MHSIIVILLGIMISNMFACASVPTDSVFKPYIAAFEGRYHAKVNYPVVFGKFERPSPNMEYLGQCHLFGMAPLQVIINVEAWYRLSSDRKLLLLYHEMAHCSLGYDHLKEKDNEYCPLNLMHPELPNQHCIDKYGVRFYLNSIKGR